MKGWIESAVYQLIIVALNEGYDTISLAGNYVTIGFISCQPTDLRKVPVKPKIN